jgi:hypothetical protein
MMEPHLYKALSQEWIALQRSFEQYEQSALATKLAAVAISVVAAFTSIDPMIVGAITILLWMQEAISRTSQARIGLRLLKVETTIAADKNGVSAPFQLHVEWDGARGNSVSLIKEYAVNGLRPTVAYIYVALLVISQVAAA